jgi:hypothetical protein
VSIDREQSEEIPNFLLINVSLCPRTIIREWPPLVIDVKIICQKMVSLNENIIQNRMTDPMATVTVGHVIYLEAGLTYFKRIIP